MVAMNAMQALFSYQNTNNWFSQTRASKSSDGPSKSLNSQFTRYSNSLFTERAARGLANIISSANQLQASVDSFRLSVAALLNNLVVTSSDNASVKAVADKGADLKSVNIRVHSLATSQTNSGTSFNASSPTILQTGSQNFSITMGNKKTNISFYANATDTHQISLGKMRDAINDSDSGVFAKIVKSSFSKNIQLELSSKDTGTTHSFSLVDVSGNAVSSTGSQFVTNAAANATYQVNGGAQQTSSSNQIKLDQGKISATLLKPTSSDVNLTSKPDTEAIVKQTQQLVKDYNSLQARISDESSYLNPAVKQNLLNLLESNDLETLGITKRSNGTLALDDTKLITQINTNFDQVSRSVNGSNGIASALSKATERLQSSPAEALLNQNNQDYKRYNNYQSSLQFYSQLPSSGLLLNNYF